MLSNDLTLKTADGVDTVFRLVSQDSTGTRRIDIASTLSLPATVVIKHSVSGKAPNVVDRHLIQLNKTLATTVGTTQLVANFTLTVPRDVAVTPTSIHDIVSMMLDMLTDGTYTGTATTPTLDAILRGES
jgi:hypothetical protein